MFVAVLGAACADEVRPVPAVVAADAGTVAGPADAEDAPSDASAPTDVGSPRDGGQSVDFGPPIRTVESAPLIPSGDRESLVLLPGFERDALNGSWLALPLTAANALPPWSTRWESDAPTERLEVAVVPGTDAYSPGAGLYGFGVSVSGALDGEIWLGVSSPERFDELVAGLIVYVEGQGPSIAFFEADEASEVEGAGRTWRRFQGSTGLAVQGRFVIGVQNESPEAVWVTAPRVYDAQPTTRTATPPRPLLEEPRWRRAAIELGAQR